MSDLAKGGQSYYFVYFLVEGFPMYTSAIRVTPKIRTLKTNIEGTMMLEVVVQASEEDAEDQARVHLNIFLQAISLTSRDFKPRISEYVKTAIAPLKGDETIPIEKTVIHIKHVVSEDQRMKVVSEASKIFSSVDWSARKNQWLSLALDYYSRAIDRHAPEERLIDSIIACEALCSREHMEIGYRLSMRIASLLGKNSRDRDRVKKAIRQAYSERSSIVHGGRTEPHTDTYRLTKYLRELLLRCIKLSQKHSKSEIIELLDQSLLSDTTRKRMRAESNFNG